MSINIFQYQVSHYPFFSIYPNDPRSIRLSPYFATSLQSSSMAENTPVEIAYAIKEVRTIYFGARIHELASKQSTHLAVGIGGWVCGVALLVLSPPLAIMYLLALTIRLCSARIFFEGLLPSSNLKLLNTCHKTRAAEALTLLTMLKSYKKEGHFSHFLWQLRA